MYIKQPHDIKYTKIACKSETSLIEESEEQNKKSNICKMYTWIVKFRIVIISFD